MVKDKSKRIIFDMLINLLGTALPLFALQIVVYPIVAKMISSEAYGQMQSIMSVVYLVSGTLGGTLSTTRLVKQYDYLQGQVDGDFSVLNIWCELIVLACTPIIIVCYVINISAIDVVLVTAVSIVNYIATYYEVGFRLKLSYSKIFVNKAIGCIGYFVGYGIFVLTLKWQVIFISSFLLQAIYCMIGSDLLKEQIKKTKFFVGTTKVFVNLGVANLLNKSLTYVDKLLLYPLLGGTAVSIYFASNIFGKLILQALEPITNVILSYLSKEKKVEKFVWKITVLVGIAFCLLMYVFCLMISRPVLSLFYPQWVEEAMKYVPVATISLCVSSYVNIIYPLTLKTLKSAVQIIINGLGLIVYVCTTLILYKSLGLMGCCLALLFSYITKLILMISFSVVKKNDW